MGSIYPRGKKLWARYKDEAGEWASAPTPFHIGEKPKAQRFVRELEARIDARKTVGASVGLEPGEAITVVKYADRWISDRRALGIRSWNDDRARLRHALPALGEMQMENVRPRHLRDLVLQLRKTSALAPRSIRHVYATLTTMFRSAVADELLTATPCVLAKGILPKKVDKDPSWRAGAIYTREEVERLISDLRIPQDRRVLYGLKGLAALRHGEAAGLRWRQYYQTLEPLAALNLEETKSQVPRRIPVHPVLASMLAEWKLAGWERTYGRVPTADDLIIPTRNLTGRQSPESQSALLGDLALLGLRRRRGHDLRRTFITLAQVDGARRDLLETITHGPRGDIINIYTSFPWPALCAEVAKLKIELREGKVLDGDFRGLATSLATVQRTARKRWTKSATPAGFELESRVLQKSKRDATLAGKSLECP
jgi:integrase